MSPLFLDFSELLSEWSEDEGEPEPVPCELLLSSLLDDTDADASKLRSSLRDVAPLFLELSLESLLLFLLLSSYLSFNS